MIQDGNLALGYLSPTKSLLNPAGAPTFCKQVLSIHLVITIQLVPEKNAHKGTIQLLQCWVNNMRSLSILLTKISLQNFSKHKRKDNLNVLNISREALLFKNICLHAPFAPFTDHPFHFGATLVLTLCYSFWLLFLSCELILVLLLFSFSRKQATQYFPQPHNYLCHYQLTLQNLKKVSQSFSWGLSEYFVRDLQCF